MSTQITRFGGVRHSPLDYRLLKYFEFRYERFVLIGRQLRTREDLGVTGGTVVCTTSSL
ncbi:MAG: hypothetical protein JO356_14425 [Acidobacteria bacterium]|nr:hypothetical protein [Acidobacteriota bacterium]